MNERSVYSRLGLERVHFVGIGGVGMSALAHILARQGIQVSGSDLHFTPLVQELQEIGVRVAVGHQPENLGDAQVIVISTAIPEDNPEVAQAHARGLPVVHRSQLLADLMRRRIGIAVSGTHGKTTTTSMLAKLLVDAGLDPTVVVGARVEQLGGNARLGKSDFMVAEADESDRSLLQLPPVCAIVTNIDLDHMDVYRDLEDLQNTFVQFAQSVPFYGLAVICQDDPATAAIAPRIRRPLLSYGLEHPANITARNLVLERDGCRFECYHNDERLGELRLNIPGRHNVLNSLGAVAVGRWLELPFSAIKGSLESFRGAERRLQFKGERNGVWVIDDYAHHPTEIRATLQACRASGRRLVVVFQPHRFSRTQHLMGKMGDCFSAADRLFILDVYPAGEKPVAGVNGSRLAQEIQAVHPARFVPEASQLLPILEQETQSGDTLLTLGAGDVWKIGEKFLG